MAIRKTLLTHMLTLALLATFASSLKADDFAYMLGETGGASNAFGTLNLNSGAFTLIGNMGSGGFAGLGVANGVLYTEQNGGLYSVNTSNASLTLVGGTVGNNIPVFGSTTSGLYGLVGVGSQNVITLVSISLAGAVTQIGAVGVIGNGQGSYARLSTGSATLYMENNGALYTVNTSTGAATLVGTDANFNANALLYENGSLYVGVNGFGVGTINAGTGAIGIHSAILGGPNSFGGLAPLSSLQTYYFSDVAFGGGYQTTLTYVNYSPKPVTCVTKFYSDAGGPLGIPFGQGTVSTRTDVLPSGGSVHDPSVASLTAPVVEGWGQASCTGPVQASVLYRLFLGGAPAGEASVIAETAPTTEFATFAQTVTGIAYGNPSMTQSATVTLTAYNTAGTKLGSQIVTLGPLAHGSANIGPLLGIANFTGFVKITSTIPIISLSLNYEAYPAFSSLPAGDLPANTILVSP